MGPVALFGVPHLFVTIQLGWTGMFEVSYWAAPRGFRPHHVKGFLFVCYKPHPFSRVLANGRSLAKFAGWEWDDWVAGHGTFSQKFVWNWVLETTKHEAIGHTAANIFGENPNWFRFFLLLHHSQWLLQLQPSIAMHSWSPLACGESCCGGKAMLDIPSWRSSVCMDTPSQYTSQYQ